QVSRLAALRAIDLAIAGSLDLRVILGVVLDEVAAQLRADAAEILRVDPATRRLEHAAGRGLTRGIARPQRPDEGLVGAVVRERRILRADAVPGRPGYPLPPLAVLEGFRTCHAAPLVTKGEVCGVLEVFHRSDFVPDEDWLEFLEALAGQAAIAMENATLFERLQRSHADLVRAYDTTLEGWSRALDLRDADTSGHTQRVAELAVRLARRMGLPDEDIVHLRRGALLHDIGKMAIPDEILRKQGPLDEPEWAIMRQHPVFAYQLLAPIPFLRPALDVPYAHHERWDGTGYPRGLKGEEIPIAARIFAVVDVWDALRSRRPYGEPWSPDAARDYLRARAGTEFDPAVVEAFLALDPPPEADWPEAAPESRNDPSRTAPDSRRR
ncbi:MAG TPA: HD domain-containing phosphohydrolase, partial [Vicinamibacterales bacterium]|nr:HD domain-containing phosphohydrolase [Vicinamibacterales bacterium]